MRWDQIKELPCSVARTLSVIGDRWTMMIIRDCFLGTRRFDDFQNQLGITRHVLTDRLNRLVDEGVLRKDPYNEGSTRHEYRLTEKGIDLYPILLAMNQWGTRWMVTEDGAPIEYIHRTCGQKAEPLTVCSECREPLDPRQVQPIVGPGLESLLRDADINELKGVASYRFLTKKN